MNKTERIFSFLSNSEKNEVLEIAEDAVHHGLNLIKTSYENLEPDMVESAMQLLTKAIAASDQEAKVNALKAIDFFLLAKKKKQTKKFLDYLLDELENIVKKAFPIIMNALLRGIK